MAGTAFMLVDVETVDVIDTELLEIGWQFTDCGFAPLGDVKSRIVRHPHGLTARQEENLFAVHRKNGLYDAIRDGLGDDVNEILDELMRDVDVKADAGLKVIPAGDTVGFDVNALKNVRPDVFQDCDYHVMDLSSIRIGLGLWDPAGFDMDRTVTHRVSSCIGMELREGQAMVGRLSRR